MLTQGIEGIVHLLVLTVRPREKNGLGDSLVGGYVFHKGTPYNPTSFETVQY